MGNIAYAFYGGLTDTANLLLIIWGIMNISFVKKKKVLAIAGIVMALLLLSAAIYYNQNPDVAIFYETCIVIIGVCFLFQGNIFKLIAYSLLAYILLSFLDASIEGIVSVLHIELEGIFRRAVFATIVVLVMSIIVLIKRSRTSSKIQVKLSKRIYALLFVGAGTGMMIIAGLLVEANSKAGETVRRIIIIITIIVVISYCTACVMMVFITESRDNYKALTQINQRVIEAQQQYYTLVNEKQQEIRSIRHEMKNHLACINGLFKADKLIEMEQYINQLIESSEVSLDLLDTGNDIVNAILNEAQSRYRKEHIAIRLEGGFPMQLYIAPLDLCVIIANLVSNAVEAIQRMNRIENDLYYVDVKISSFKNDLYINVNNPIDKNINIVNGVLITCKKDKNLHGFGVSNVKNKVEKYHGTYDYRIENNQFCVEINMKNNVQ